MNTSAPANASQILIVDDESMILDLYRLHLGREFRVDTAESGEQAMKLLSLNGPYAVVVADMHMPGMSGSELLRQVQNVAPDTVRIMLTADDRRTVVLEAVNNREVFRFLNKPCTADVLAAAVRAGLQQYQLRRHEKELLASTLNGCIQLLVEMLSLVNPLAFGRSLRTKRIVQNLADRLNVTDSWEISVAALLSHVGCISLPESILKKVQRGVELTAQELSQYRSHPRLGHDLIARIPRLKRVADIISLQENHAAQMDAHDPGFSTPGRRAGFLKIALDYDLLTEQGQKPQHVIRRLMAQPDLYDEQLLTAMKEMVESEQNRRVCGVTYAQLQTGMVLQDDIVDSQGVVLVTQGQEITESLLDRLKFQRENGRRILEPIQVLHSQEAPAETPAVEFPSVPLLAPDPDWQLTSATADE